jgi:hypothetical protein
MEPDGKLVLISAGMEEKDSEGCKTKLPSFHRSYKFKIEDGWLLARKTILLKFLQLKNFFIDASLHKNV